MDDSYLPLMTLGMNVWVMSVVRTAIVDLIVETQAQRLEDVVLDEKVVCDDGVYSLVACTVQLFLSAQSLLKFLGIVAMGAEQACEVELMAC